MGSTYADLGSHLPATSRANAANSSYAAAWQDKPLVRAILRFELIDNASSRSQGHRLAQDHWQSSRRSEGDWGIASSSLEQEGQSALIQADWFDDYADCLERQIRSLQEIMSDHRGASRSYRIGASGEQAVAASLERVIIDLAITLVIVIRVWRPHRNTTDFFAAGRTFTGGQNGNAIAGNYLSAASIIGLAGANAIYGFDGFL